MKIEKVQKLLANLNDKEEYVIHIRNLKQGIKSRISVYKSDLNLSKHLG